MIIGFAFATVGYALFYWGLHHMPWMKRYSLWVLLGFDQLFNTPQIAETTGAGEGVQIH